jgi:ATP-dependent helicase/nuclease subunit A
MSSADIQNRFKCLDLKSIIVQAPAGSGKTELLTQRFIKLLAHVNSPREILAVTFTNKAAAEMKNRITNYLQNKTAPKNETTKKLIDLLNKEITRRGITVDEIISEFNILTIDALNQQIINSTPLLTQYGYQSSIIEDPVPIYSEIIKKVIYADTNSDTIHKILHTLNIEFPQLEKYLLELMTNRDKWIHHIFDDENSNEFNRYIQQEEDESLTHLQKIFKLNDSIHSKKKELLHFIESIYTKQKSIRKNIKEEDLLFFKLNSVSNDITNMEWPKFESFEKEYYFLNISNLQQNDIMQTLAPILKEAYARIKIYFSQNKVIDFPEITLQALLALKNESGFTDLKSYLNIKYSHILIDEFQDTNKNQLQLFEYLTHEWGPENTFFCVGDPMQSIYRFRQSDVRIFLDVIKNGIGKIKLNHIILSVNNRSKSRLIHWFNSRFSKIFTEQNIDNGSIQYQLCSPRIEDDSGSINFLSYNSKSSSKSSDIEAKLICQQILASQHESIAVIARSRNHLKPIVSYIKKNYAKQIPINAIELESLINHQCVQDILALTLAILDFSDRTHWIATIQSPLCGLTIKDLHILFASKDENIWKLINSEKVNELNSESQNRIKNLIKIIKIHYSSIHTAKWSEIIRALWVDLAGIKSLYAKEDIEYIDYYLRILQNFDTNEIDKEVLINTVTETMVSDVNSNKKAVSFLTIHKSKGLEFDHVIIPGVDKSTRPNIPSLVNFDHMDGANKNISSIKFNDDEIYSLHGYHEQKNKIREHNELKRLLYVAVTRAINQLDLITEINQTTKKNTFLHFLWDDFYTTDPQSVDIDTPTSKYEKFSPKLFNIPLSEYINEKKESLKEFSPISVKENYSIETEEIYVGIIVHKYLELVHKNFDINHHDQFVEKMLNTLNIDKSLNLKEIANESMICINNIHQTESGRKILKKYDNDQCELKVSIPNRDQTNYRVDRTFINNNERWIIDYKYHKEKDNLNTLALNYKNQLDRYASFFTDHKVRQFIYFLKQGELIEI